MALFNIIPTTVPFLLKIFIACQLVFGVLATEECQTNWTSVEDGLCSRIFHIPKTYSDAEAHCYRHGGTLATVSSTTTHHRLGELISEEPFNVWVAVNASWFYNSLTIGLASTEEWPMEMDIEPTGREGDRCVLLRPWDQGYSLSFCGSDAHYVCEVYVGNQRLCPKGWMLYFREDVCIGYIERYESWYGAHRDCQNYGGSLVKIWNREKRFFVYDADPTRFQIAWVGIRHHAPTNTFQFVDSTSIRLVNTPTWPGSDVIPGEDSARCMVLGKYRRGLVKEDCNHTHFFFCQKMLAHGSTCSPPWQRVDDRVCIKEVLELRTWEDAKTVCEREDSGHLASVDSDWSIRFLTGSPRSRRLLQYWVFNNDVNGDGRWQWHYQVIDWSSRWYYDSRITDLSNDRYCFIVDRRNRGFFRPAECGHLLYFFCETPMESAVTCPSPWKWFEPEGVCVREYSERMNWTDAIAFCMSHGNTNISRVDSETKLHFLQDTVRTDQDMAYWVINGHVNDHNSWHATYWEDLFPRTPSIPDLSNPRRDNCIRMEPYNGFKRTGCLARYYFICEQDMSSQRTCSPLWTPYNPDGVCIKVIQLARNYEGARYYCQHLGGDLVQIVSDTKLATVRGGLLYFLSQFPHWIGFYGNRTWQLETYDNFFMKWPLVMTEMSDDPDEEQINCMAMHGNPNMYRGRDCLSELSYGCEKRARRGRWCIYGWHRYPRENVCIKVFFIYKSYKAATLSCRNLEADLVRVWNTEKEYFIREISPRTIYESRLSVWIGMERDDSGQYWMGTRSILPVNPASLEWSDIEVMEFQKTDRCLILGRLETGLIKRPCDAQHFILCEKRAQSRLACPSDWSSFQDGEERTCVKAFDHQMDTWEISRDFCQQRHAHLPEIRSKEKLTFLRGMRGWRVNEGHWLAMKDVREIGVLSYLNGSSYFHSAPDSPPWEGSFPIRHKNRCVMTNRIRNEYTARSCNTKYHFVCQKDPRHYSFA